MTQVFDQAYGWDYIDNNISSNYINVIKKFISSETEFSTFRQRLGSTGILEGDASCGQLWLNMILERYGDSILKEKLELFKRNDIYGSPVINNYGEYGDICPFTLLYILQGLNAMHKFKHNQFNKIVEIGPGYGALCIIMDALCNFKEYVIVDLPDVVELNKKYLVNFPEIYKKVTFIPCNELTNISNIDLVISAAAISECNTDTQLNYFDKIIKNSTFAYLTYNRHNESFFTEANQIFNSNIETLGAGVVDYFLTKK